MDKYIKGCDPYHHTGKGKSKGSKGGEFFVFKSKFKGKIKIEPSFF